MYQTLVIGLGVLAVVGMGFFINEAAGGSDSIKSTFLQSTATHAVAQETISRDAVPGTYVCNAISGCTNAHTLSIRSNGEAAMTTSFDGGVEVLEEKGSWTLDESGNMTVLLKESFGASYTTPRVIAVRNVSSASLSSISIDTRIYGKTNKASFKKN